MNELTFEFFTGPDMTSPVDHYVQHLVDAGVSIPWEPIPDGEPGTPGFRFHDTERNWKHVSPMADWKCGPSNGLQLAAPTSFMSFTQCCREQRHRTKKPQRISIILRRKC